MARIREVEATSAGPDAPAAREVLAVVAACDPADGVSTLNEQARLQLTHHGLLGARVWLSGPADDAPADGFALLRGEVLDLAVRPDARGSGTGIALAAAALAATGRVEAWSHGNHPAAARIAARFGIPAARELQIMRRPTSAPLSRPREPDGVRIRTFRPDDEGALLDLNARAFASHPEQGRMTREDFRERVSESWFDPGGLFLAVPEDPGEDDRLLGFHWTKVHRDEDPPYGEVYVVAVSPDAAGRGLGTVLTDVGLRHLADQGVDDVILYVEGDNAPAIALYTGQGFEVVRTEVQYRGTTDV